MSRQPPLSPGPRGRAIRFTCACCLSTTAAYEGEDPGPASDPWKFIQGRWCCPRCATLPVTYRCSWPGCSVTARGPQHEAPAGWEADSNGDWFDPVCAEKPRRRSK